MTPDYVMSLHPNSLARRDWETQKVRTELGELAERCADVSGISIRQMLKESQKGQSWPGQMSGREYLEQRLYLLGKNERKQFISTALNQTVDKICNDQEWADQVDKKWTCTDILESSGITTIPVKAVVDSSGTSYGSTQTITSAEELASFLAGASFPLFAKPNQLLASLGVFQIEGFDGELVTTHGGEQLTTTDLLHEFMADIPYVIQQVQTNHDQIAAFAGGLATIRMVNFVSDGCVRVDRSVLKIPGTGEVADNSWRAGSFIADIDVESGEILRVSTGKGGDYQEFDVHPETGSQMVGVTLPYWDQARDLNEKSALLFPQLPVQSADVAITPDGPLIVEVNSGGAFELPQLASGRGLLTDENKAFYESCGVDFRSLRSETAEAA